MKASHRSVASHSFFHSMENENLRCDDEAWKLRIQRKRFNGKLGMEGKKFFGAEMNEL